MSKKVWDSLCINLSLWSLTLLRSAVITWQYLSHNSVPQPVILSCSRRVTKNFNPFLHAFTSLLWSHSNPQVVGLVVDCWLHYLFYLKTNRVPFARLTSLVHIHKEERPLVLQIHNSQDSLYVLQCWDNLVFVTQGCMFPCWKLRTNWVNQACRHCLSLDSTAPPQNWFQNIKSG